MDRRDREALTVLAALAIADETPDWALLDLASLYVLLDRVDIGYRTFLALRERRDSPAVHLGWAVLATASGRPDDALNWLGKGSLRRLGGSIRVHSESSRVSPAATWRHAQPRPGSSTALTGHARRWP